MDPAGTAGDAGQGTTESQGGSIFEPYLQSVPEEHREAVGGYLKDAEKQVNERVESAAKLEKQWGPYKDVDLSGWDPQKLGGLLEWYGSVTASPEAYQEWLTAEANEAGLGAAQEQEDDSGLDGLSPQQLQALIQQQAQSQVAPLQQQLQEFQKEQQVAGIERQIENGFARIEAQVGRKLSDDEKQAIADLGESHPGDDFIEHGFQRYQALSGQAQAQLVQHKLGQPGPSLSAGSQEAPKLPKDLKELEAMAEEGLRNALSS